MPSTTQEDLQSHQLHHQLHSKPSASASGSRNPHAGAFASPGRSNSHPPPLPPIASSRTNVLNVALSSSKSVASSDFQSRLNTPHRRSNSLSGFKDGIGNLNRWSQSTISSKGSSSHKRSSSFSRRMSFGGSGAFAISLPTFQGNGNQSPNKLQKGRSLVTEPDQEEGSLPGFSDMATSLPPIITSPTLDAKNNGTSPLTVADSTPSTAGLLSAAVRTTVPDYFNQTWEGSLGDSVQRGTPRVRLADDASSLAMEPTKASQLNENPIRRQRLERERSHSRGHSRNRSQAGKGSSDTMSSNKSRDRPPKPPSQKAMLSKALQKANTAVVLDNAQNFEGAMEAYAEACNLLHQVMNRSSGDEDKRKLEAIRNTYTNRIMELEKITPQLLDDSKALPARPESIGYRDDDINSPVDVDRDSAIIGTALVTKFINEESYVAEARNGAISASQLPRRRDSLLPSPFASNSSRLPNSLHARAGSISKSPMREGGLLEAGILLTPMDREYMPPPLSPRPSNPRDYQETAKERSNQTIAERNIDNASPGKTHQRAASNESMSWLDTIDESVGSTTSSVHSRTSSLAVRRKHIRSPSGATEAEFDAALDAAVEAAYDEGFEPEEPRHVDATFVSETYDEDLVANVRRRVELARERVRQTERETAINLARDREKTRRMQESRAQPMDVEYDGNGSEEEERLLEEMTREYVMDDFEFGLQSNPTLPRQSDSSGFSGRTANSSIGSNPTTAGTPLSTVAEASVLSDKSSYLSRKNQVQATSIQLPPMPLNSISSPPHAPFTTDQSVRSRRLSGQNAQQLKIETTTKVTGSIGTSVQVDPKSEVASSADLPLPSSSQITGVSSQSRAAIPNIPSNPLALYQSSRQASSPLPGASPSENISPPTPTIAHAFGLESESNIPLPRSGSPARAQSRSGLRKNFSSSSLKNMKSRNLSVSNIDDGSDISPSTPLGIPFSGSSSVRDATGKIPVIPTLPTPIATAFRDKMSGATAGGLYLFNNDINSPESPGSPNSTIHGGPIPLEPCPAEYLLRPFWLMRALYQTIAHPRGGYLSNKLFVPRDVWRVKGVKIRYKEDKIACCDFLTAALLKLSKVDNCDADAVLDEMQSLEGVLEQVQVTLTRKLGNEVGIQASSMLFRDAPNINDTEATTLNTRISTSNGKSSFSWRRLRSKNSGTGLSTAYGTKPSSADGLKEGLTMASLPMTSLTTIRLAKRDVSQVQFSGPNAIYMGALARLFDAVQVVDQIARQVEDPGLRHADKTQVGLELSTRHAAEFFGFYICRFVLTDISLLLDKFIKRGSEWVLM